MRKYNPAMLCDFYEFTMSNGYFQRTKLQPITCDTDSSRPQRKAMVVTAR